MKIRRRQLLLAGGLLGGGAYINSRGLRYPRLGFEPSPVATYKNYLDAEVRVKDLIFLKHDQVGTINLRAYTPAAKISLKPHKPELLISVNNVATDAKLQVEGDPAATVSEDVFGITRVLRINKAKDREIELSWPLDALQKRRFAVIGDTGGGDELGWCISRAQQLRAKFLLHLGDFNYGPSEYGKAIQKFREAPLPIYVSIGNHDFNDSGLVYERFRHHIGPMNNAFSLAGTRFINLDTAASFFPAYAGNRGALVAQLEKDSTTYSDQLIYTHKPFVDTRAGKDHNLSGVGEIDWVRSTMNQLGVKNFLCGHVHRSTELGVQGITQWTAGEGLGYEDLRNQTQTAKILLGEAQPGRKIKFRWEPLQMPWKLHTSPTHAAKLARDGLSEWYRTMMQGLAD